MRRLALAAIAALATLPALALAETKPSGVEAAVLAAQDQRFAATIAGDTAALAAMLSDDLTYTHSNAETDTKASLIEGLKSGKYLYREIKPGERRVRVWGDVAAVSGPCHIVIEPGGKRTEIDLYFTELYVKQSGRWKMALWQSTRPPTPAPAAAK